MLRAPAWSSLFVRATCASNGCPEGLTSNGAQRRMGLNRALSTTAAPALPTQAQCIVVGGGIIGTSVAYHLAHMGMKDVVLLEQSQLTSGTTWHAAGLMGCFGTMSETSMTMRQYSKKMYSHLLEEETGLSCGFRGCGFIELAANADRLEEYRRVATFNRFLGVDVHEISPQEVKRLMPMTKVDDIVGGFYVPTDGRVNPVDATMALAKGARMQGAKIHQGVTVSKILQKDGKVTGVQTSTGKEIKAEYVVNCAGMWARQLGETVGNNISLQAAEHYYLITEPIAGVDPKWPVVEDPHSYGYYREEGGGIMVGLFEAKAAAWKVNRIPDQFSFGEIEPDWERMAPFLEKAMARIPATENAGIKKFFCGPESFTPDLAPLVGETPEVKNLFVLAGLNSIGITTGPGIGRLLAHWIIHGKSDLDVTGMNVDRMQAFQMTPQYRAERVVESLGLVYKCHYPYKTKQTCRGIKLSPVHDRLVAARAFFRDVSGWEGADWFAPPGVKPEVDVHKFGRENWFPYWADEHKAAREKVVMCDMSFMSKFAVEGKNAGKFLNYLCGNDVDGEEKMITYTQFLNDEGKLEGDVTVAKLAPEKYMVVVTDTQHRHAEFHMRHRLRLPQGQGVTVRDVTQDFGQLNVQGPNSRALLQTLIQEDLSNEAFPFRSARTVHLKKGGISFTMIRITYLGELGFECYVKKGEALQLYDQLFTKENAATFGLRNCGLKALGSLRMEKGYRDFGHDMDNTDTVLEAGLGFAVDLKKKDPFIGKEAVLAQKALGPLKKRLVQIFVLNPEPFLFHNEVIFRDGKALGYCRGGSYGHTLGGACGLAMLEANEAINKEFLDTGVWEIEINGARYPMKANLNPFYDPKNLKIKA